ncbi:MAG TPA: alpha/beta hydrolase [Actinomycetota bacterium]|nr:alpha/beta hydrolase [Actinomycetota bacterium]
MDAATRTVSIDGLGVRVLDAGDGEPVVVLHGWGGRIESMAPVVACLRGRFRALALDLPGFGESAPPPGAWGTPDYAAFVRDALALLGVRRAHFVGHSFGAKTSLYLSAVHPELVDKLVLVGSSGLRTPPSLRARAKRVASRAGRAAGRLGPPGRALRDAVYRRVASQDYRDAGALRPVLVTVVNEDLRDMLPRVRSSTLLVWGTQDDAVPVAHARTMERLIPDAGLVLFEGAGHFAYLDEPERFCRVVRHFLGAGAS